jgi:hypothetical protein
VSDSPAFHSKWLLLLQIEISLVVNFCFITNAGLSDTQLKGTYPGTIPARFDLIWFSGFRGEDLNGQYESNFGGMVLGWPPSKIVSGDPAYQPS